MNAAHSMPPILNFNCFHTSPHSLNHTTTMTEPTRNNACHLYAEPVPAFIPKKDFTHTWRCVICRGDFQGGYGNNPQPIYQDGRCCDWCNHQKVMMTRITQPCWDNSTDPEKVRFRIGYVLEGLQRRWNASN